MTRAPKGIQPEPLTAWLEAELRLAPPLDFQPIAGGASNLTFVVTDGNGRRVVLRRPPTGHVLASAHDMGREHRVISALAPTPVPVPPALGLCTDPDVNGADFYVMDFVDGAVVFDRADAEKVAEAVRPVMARSIVDTLADLHALDPDEVGLGETSADGRITAPASCGAGSARRTRAPTATCGWYASSTTGWWRLRTRDPADRRAVSRGRTGRRRSRVRR